MNCNTTNFQCASESRTEYFFIDPVPKSRKAHRAFVLNTILGRQAALEAYGGVMTLRPARKVQVVKEQEEAEARDPKGRLVYIPCFMSSC